MGRLKKGERSGGVTVRNWSLGKRELRGKGRKCMAGRNGKE